MDTHNSGEPPGMSPENLPATPEDAAEIIARLFDNFPQRDANDEILTNRVRGYMIAIEGFSFACLLEAERRVYRGQATVDERNPVSPRYMPTPPQFYGLCATIAQAAWRSSARPALVYERPPELTPEEQKRRAKVVQKALRKLSPE